MRRQSITVRLSERERREIDKISGDSLSDSVRFLLDFYLESKERNDHLEKVGDRIIASITARIGSDSQSQNSGIDSQILEEIREEISLIPGKIRQSGGSDPVLRQAVAGMVKHGILPTVSMDRKKPLNDIVGLLEGTGK